MTDGLIVLEPVTVVPLEDDYGKGHDALCLSIKTEDDSAQVLDDGVLKIDRQHT